MQKETKQETKLCSGRKAGGGEVNVSAGEQGTPIYSPPKAKKRLREAMQTVTQGYSHHLKSHFINSDLSSPQDEQFVCTSEEAKAPEMGS